jgi:hypothetical protein
MGETAVLDSGTCPKLSSPLRLCLLLALLALCAPAFSAEVYRSVDADGNVVYSDRPLSDAKESVKVNVAVTTPTARAPLARPPRAAEAADGGEPDEAVARAAEEAQRAEDRERNCSLARDRNTRYENSRRLYRELPDGEREYLDDAEIDAAKARAREDVAKWCS